jgi:hypothetical protein
MPETTVPLNYNPADHRWIVRLAFRFKNQAQAETVQSLGKLAWDVVRLWCDVRIPDARVFEPQGTPIESIGFPTRASARRFIATWGGRIVTSAPSIATAPAC